MMDKRGLILCIAITVIFIVIATIYLLNNQEINIENPNNYIGSEIELNENREVNENFKVDLTEEKDHYILTVQTNKIKEDFGFSYNSKDFVLDTSNTLFDYANVIQDGDNKNVSIELESNNMYKFFFIKKTNKELKLGKNLIIN
jgi:hypothetical protein